MTKRIDIDAEINSIRLKEQPSAPATPDSGYGQVYELNDGRPYFKNDAGVVIDLIGSIAPGNLYVSGTSTLAGNTLEKGNLDVIGTLHVTGTAQFMGDVYTVPWTQWGSGSAIGGWSSFTVKNIFYTRIGDFIFVSFNIQGTGAGTSGTFSLPYAASGEMYIDSAIKTTNSGSANVGYIFVTPSSAIITARPTMTSTVWIPEGTKIVSGNFFYHTDDPV